MAVAEKNSSWGPCPAEDPFVHPVKRLCLRAESPSTAQEEIAFNPFLAPAGVPLDLNAPPAGDEAALPLVSLSAPSAPAAPSLDCLGEDLLLHVLRLAQPTAWDLCRMACVSRVWRDACYNQFFWTKLRVGPGSMRPGVEQLSLRCRSLKELHIDDPQCELHILHPIVVACGPSLRRVSINCDMDASSQSEASICSILWIISLYCKNVDSIELLSDGKRRGFSYLETKVLWFLTSGFRSVRSFASLCQESVTKQSLYLMVIAWRDLACLRIHSALLGRDDLASLRKCHALRVLELVGGKLSSLVGDAASGTLAHKTIHPRLEVAVLSSTPCEPQEVVAFANLCPALRRILVSKDSWAHGETVHEMVERRSKLKQLQGWFKSAKGIELMVEE